MTCGGRLTIEHAFGRKNQKSWQCVWLCEKHHGLGDYWSKKYFDKNLNKLYAYLQATESELRSEKQASTMIQEFTYLKQKYKLAKISI